MSAYDSFVRDRLPPAELQPEFLLLDYPARLNAAAAPKRRGKSKVMPRPKVKAIGALVMNTSPGLGLTR